MNKIMFYLSFKVKSFSEQALYFCSRYLFIENSHKAYGCGNQTTVLFNGTDAISSVPTRPFPRATQYSQ